MFGPPRVVPTPPVTQNPCQFGGYIERYQEIQQVKELAKREGFAFTAVMPPNICGPGKIPMDCIGDRDINQHKAMKAGKPVTLPENCNTLIGPCDASDIANIFRLAVQNRQAAADEIFNAGSAYALTAPQFIETFGKIYKSTIPINYVPQEKYYKEVLPDLGCNYHFRHHMCPDISKTSGKLGYQPEFTPEETLERAVAWMVDEKLL
jgi:nucleoside-diphosphate-sugar epimerase